MPNREETLKAVNKELYDLIESFSDRELGSKDVIFAMLTVSLAMLFAMAPSDEAASEMLREAMEHANPGLIAVVRCIERDELNEFLRSN